MAKQFLDATGLLYLWTKMKTVFQEKLVSGTNIKSINGNSILGGGNINITTDLSEYVTDTELNDKINTAKADILENVANGYQVKGNFLSIANGNNNDLKGADIKITDSNDGLYTDSSLNIDNNKCYVDYPSEGITGIFYNHIKIRNIELSNDGNNLTFNGTLVAEALTENEINDILV